MRSGSSAVVLLLAGAASAFQSGGIKEINSASLLTLQKRCPASLIVAPRNDDVRVSSTSSTALASSLLGRPVETSGPNRLGINPYVYDVILENGKLMTDVPSRRVKAVKESQSGVGDDGKTSFLPVGSSVEVQGVYGTISTVKAVRDDGKYELLAGNGAIGRNGRQPYYDTNYDYYSTRNGDYHDDYDYGYGYDYSYNGDYRQRTGNGLQEENYLGSKNNIRAGSYMNSHMDRIGETSSTDGRSFLARGGNVGFGNRYYDEPSDRYYQPEDRYYADNGQRYYDNDRYNAPQDQYFYRSGRNVAPDVPYFSRRGQERKPSYFRRRAGTASTRLDEYNSPYLNNFLGSMRTYSLADRDNQGSYGYGSGRRSLGHGVVAPSRNDRRRREDYQRRGGSYYYLPQQGRQDRYYKRSGRGVLAPEYDEDFYRRRGGNRFYNSPSRKSRGRYHRPDYNRNEDNIRRREYANDREFVEGNGRHHPRGLGFRSGIHSRCRP